jgi:hypothetical protein
MGIVVAPARQAQGMTAVNARKVLLENGLGFMASNATQKRFQFHRNLLRPDR